MAKKKRKPARSEQEKRIVPLDAPTIEFVRRLVARGQAARANKDGSLPPGVTHEIVGETELGDPIVVRRRMA